jgi:hypothetical protein
MGTMTWTKRRQLYLQAKAARPSAPRPSQRKEGTPTVPPSKIAPMWRKQNWNRFDDPIQGVIWEAEYRHQAIDTRVTIQLVRFRDSHGWKVRYIGPDGSRSVMRQAQRQAERATPQELIIHVDRHMERWLLALATPWQIHRQTVTVEGK